MAALWWVVLRKIVYLSKENRITTISDFIASRYGKSLSLSALVTFVAVVGITPYLGLQLKAVMNSIAMLSGRPGRKPCRRMVHRPAPGRVRRYLRCPAPGRIRAARRPCLRRCLRIRHQAGGLHGRRHFRHLRHLQRLRGYLLRRSRTVPTPRSRRSARARRSASWNGPRSRSCR